MTTNSFETWQKIAAEVDLLLRLPNGQRVFREQTHVATDQAVEKRRVEDEQAEHDDQFSDGPLPIPTRVLETCEKFAALSAIYDAYLKGVEKVAPWGTSANQKAVLSGLPESGVPEDQYRQATWYYLLVDAAGKLDTDEIPTVASWLADVESVLVTYPPKADRYKHPKSLTVKDRIEVDVKACRVRLGSTWHKVSLNAALLLEACVKSHPKPASASDLEGEIRPKRVSESLPPELNAVFRSKKGVGCWLEFES